MGFSRGRQDPRLPAAARRQHQKIRGHEPGHRRQGIRPLTAVRVQASTTKIEASSRGKTFGVLRRRRCCHRTLAPRSPDGAAEELRPVLGMPPERCASQLSPDGSPTSTPASRLRPTAAAPWSSRQQIRDFTATALPSNQEAS
jgi:hypothetical protein